MSKDGKISSAGVTHDQVVEYINEVVGGDDPLAPLELAQRIALKALENSNGDSLKTVVRDADEQPLYAMIVVKGEGTGEIVAAVDAIEDRWEREHDQKVETNGQQPTAKSHELE